VIWRALELLGAGLALVGLMGLVVVCCGCTRTAPTPMPTASAEAIYTALVQAGCLAPDDSGVGAVQLGAASNAAPPWFTCLIDGGTIASCGVPCGDSAGNP
jgi:hypothetical protein